VTYQRDPLSVLFDRQVRVVIGLAIDQRRKHDANARLVEYVRVRVPQRRGDLLRDDGGLSAAERAFQRSMYHDERIHKARANSGQWSLRLDWEPVPVIPGRDRGLRVTVFPETAGRRHVSRNVKPRRQWQHTEALQSGGIGSPKQRFPAA